jgi:hypothetical protein
LIFTCCANAEDDCVNKRLTLILVERLGAIVGERGREGQRNTARVTLAGMDDPTLVAGLVEAVQADTVAFLKANRSRLMRCARLLDRFDDACQAWREERVVDARQIMETVNELLIAKRFLQDPLCARVEYEPSLDDGDNKTVDFLFHTIEGKHLL